jgi:hypothetical protein
MLELGIELLINPFTKVGCDSLEESLANVPACLHAFLLLFLAFVHMGEGDVVNGRVIAVRFGLLDVHGDAGLMVVFIDA